MLETVITLKPTSERRKVDTWYSSWAPEWAKSLLRRVTPDHISRETLVNEMNAALTLPGVSNAWTMPIKGRIDMLSTGVRTPVGLKISGAKSEDIEAIGAKIEALLPSVPGTRSVFAERAGNGLLSRHQMEARRARAARPLHRGSAGRRAERNRRRERTTTVEGRERYPVICPLHARLPFGHRSARARAAASPAASARYRSVLRDAHGLRPVDDP